ncbi:MAG: uroporphyrinogen decarboxylase [Chloroflexota bacterium]
MAEFNDRFLRACRRQPVDCTPVWFMRQAGRALPEYRRLRERYSLFDLIRNPELAARVTLLPVETLGVDAAILFADLTLPYLGMGVEFEVVENRGPVLLRPLQTEKDIEGLRPLEPEADLEFVLETIRLVRPELKVPLIGFVGAPFTLAAYLVDGGPSRDFPETRALMYRRPDLWDRLMGLLAESVARFAAAQARAGAHAIQVFDSWVGVLGPEAYRRWVLPYSAAVFRAIAQAGVPAIHFGTGTAGLLELMRAAGGDIIGLDWRVELGSAWDRLGAEVGVQGNLDPGVLLAPFGVVAAEARRVLDGARGRPGHIFNLGHGVLPNTPVDTLKALVDLVHTDTSGRKD